MTDFEVDNLLPEKYIIAVGSLYNSIKQFDKLIEAYATSCLPEKNIPLVILGKGFDEENLRKLINRLKINDSVLLLGFKNKPSAYIKNAAYLVLSSKMEGFPNVILESLTVGTPVISFDCKSGPSEMIVDKQNGLLVKDQDFKELKNAMELLVNDVALYNHCKQQTNLTLNKFALNTVLTKWEKLLN